MTETRRRVPKIPPVGVPVSVSQDRRGTSIRVRVRWTVDGRQTGVTKSFPRSPEREQKIADFIESIRMSKRERLVPRLTVRDFVQKIGEDSLYERLAPSTERTYRSALRVHVLPLLGETEMTELNARRIRQFARSIQGDSTRGNCLNLISRICKRGIDLGYLTENPVTIAEVQRTLEPAQPRNIIRSAAQEEKLFEGIEAVNPRYADALRVTLGCALRIGETCGLQAGDYDSATHLLTIERQLDSHGGVRPPKYGSSRQVPVDRQTHEVLMKCQGDLPVGTPLFSRDGVGRLSVSTMRKQLKWNDLCSSVGLEGFHLHDLRHTGLTRLCRRLARAGEPLTTIKTIAGHRSVRTTESYIHTTEDDMRRAAEALWT